MDYFGQATASSNPAQCDRRGSNWDGETKRAATTADAATADPATAKSAPTAAATDASDQKAKATAAGFANVIVLRLRSASAEAALIVNAAPDDFQRLAWEIFCDGRFVCRRLRW